GLVEQVVAPADGGVHRPMSQLAAGGSGRHAPLAAGDEAAAELVETPTAELTGSQLERQREPVEPVAEVGDAWGGDVPHRPRLGLTGPLDEQLDGCLGEWLDGHEVLTGETEWLPAGREHVPGTAVSERDVHEARHGVDDVLAVVQHDQHRSVGEVAAELGAR